MSLHFSPFSPFRPFRTTAEGVRSGDVIRTALSPALDSLEIVAVYRETFTNPEGRTLRVVRYDGWRLFDGQPMYGADGQRAGFVRRGWGQVEGGRVTVVGDTSPRRMRPHYWQAIAAERAYLDRAVRER